jgi:hypothetical protein
MVLAEMSKTRKSGRSSKATEKGAAAKKQQQVVIKATAAVKKVVKPKRNEPNKPNVTAKRKKVATETLKNGKLSTQSEEEVEDEVDSNLVSLVTPEKTNSPHLFLFSESGFKRVYNLDNGIDLSSGEGKFMRRCTGEDALDIWTNKFHYPVESSSRTENTDEVSVAKESINEEIEEEHNVKKSRSMESGASVSVNSARKKNTNVASSGNDEDDVRDKKAAIIERAKQYRDKGYGKKFSIRFDISGPLLKDGKEIYKIVFDISSSTAQFWIYKANAFAEALNEIAQDDKKELNETVRLALKQFVVMYVRETPNGDNIQRSVTSKDGRIFLTRTLYTTVNITPGTMGGSRSILESVANKISSIVRSDVFRDFYLIMLEASNMDALRVKIQSPNHDVWNQLRNMGLKINHGKALSCNMLDEDITEIMENITGHASKNKWNKSEKSVAYESFE